MTRWKPLPGPQNLAYNSEADILFYGGAAGGGKSSLLLGIAHQQHQHSIIFRREYPQLRGLVEDSHKIYSDLGWYHSTNMIWRLNDGRYIEFGAVKDEADKEKFQGRAHDLKAFDEITHFTRSQFTFLIAWNRSTIPNQRCRVICTGNPPTSAEGDWVIDFWAPWLDERHPNPAAPGELRWFTNIDGKDIECANGEPFEHQGQIIRPLSRTFIPASIDDNPYLRDSGYKATLQALPRELREKMLYGKFSSSREDNPWQVIPSEWVQAAQQRWRERPKPNLPCHSIGVDVARGGADRTVISKLHGNWIDEQKIYPGTTTPDGPYVVSLIIPELDNGTKINVDVIGVGTSVYDQCNILKLDVYPINSAAGSEELDRTEQLSFFNKRAEMWWKLREALDPEHGIELALPDSRELLSDLTAPRWSLTSSRGIKVEPKEDIIKRIGRSPDLGDSIVYALYIGHQKMAFASL